jgi:hypothetical protein
MNNKICKRKSRSRYLSAGIGKNRSAVFGGNVESLPDRYSVSVNNTLRHELLALFDTACHFVT